SWGATPVLPLGIYRFIEEKNGADARKCRQVRSLSRLIARSTGASRVREKWGLLSGAGLADSGYKLAICIAEEFDFSARVQASAAWVSTSSYGRRVMSARAI